MLTHPGEDYSKGPLVNTHTWFLKAIRTPANTAMLSVPMRTQTWVLRQAMRGQLAPEERGWAVRSQQYCRESLHALLNHFNLHTSQPLPNSCPSVP